jgi:hypothetical protein
LNEVIPEVLGPETGGGPERLKRVRVLGLFGTLLALLTMFAAFGFGLLILFGTTVASAGLLWALWPRIFSPEFTSWVFGAPRVEFWKLFLLFLAAGAVVRTFRRQLWQRR